MNYIHFNCMIFIRTRESDKALDHKHFRQDSNTLDPHVYLVDVNKKRK